jgi:hypothetical protein
VCFHVHFLSLLIQLARTSAESENLIGARSDILGKFILENMVLEHLSNLFGEKEIVSRAW